MVGVFLAVAFYVAVLLIVAMHEVLGHGGVAALLGGSLEEFSVTPIGGVAWTVSPDSPGDWKRLAIAAGGPAINLFAGTLFWPLSRRVRGFAPSVLAWDVAFGNLIYAIIYLGVAPLLELALGTQRGDGMRVFAALGIFPLWPALAACVAGLWVTALAMRRGQELVGRYLAPERPLGPFRATWLLLWPGVALVSIYFVAVAPQLDAFFLFSYPFALAVFLAFTALGAGLLAIRGRGGGSDTVSSLHAAGYPAVPDLAGWSLAGLLVGVACLMFFGPVPQ
ncbi:MAG: site-2 protease family protein [Chloroflexi bacterium]|nr:site-2 protease family protein [Chloroflexota bacterium]